MIITPQILIQQSVETEKETTIFLHMKDRTEDSMNFTLNILKVSSDISKIFVFIWGVKSYLICSHIQSEKTFWISIKSDIKERCFDILEREVPQDSLYFSSLLHFLNHISVLLK